ncbi:MAG: S1/P1 nuclease [Anaeromyxobacter sp.]
MPSARLRFLQLTLALVAGLAPRVTQAWGKDGHVVVAVIAEERLSPEARQMVTEILGEVPMSDPDVASWADAQKDKETRRWHYVNIPFGAQYLSSRDCAKGCAVEAISRFEQVLRRGGSAMDRADALRWLIHLTADLHQPLHAGDGRDRGGNELRVRKGKSRQPGNFHEIWDHDVVDALVKHGGRREVGRALGQAVTAEQARAWAAQLTPAQWAEGSNAEAQAIYAELDRVPGERSILRLDRGYAGTQRERTALALERAGVRLAALLDRIARERAIPRP